MFISDSKIMKKILIAVAALAAFVSCQSLKEEWQPVLGSAAEPASEEFVNYDSRVTHTIAAFKALYTTSKSPVKIDENIWIKGQVVSSDRTGNVYRELYIQDGTGVLDVKVGRSSMYSDYHLGQWIYINCKGLVLGEYDGTLQLGVEKDSRGPNADYEVGIAQSSQRFCEGRQTQIGCSGKGGTAPQEFSSVHNIYIMRCKDTQNSSKFKVRSSKFLSVPPDLQYFGRVYG